MNNWWKIAILHFATFPQKLTSPLWTYPSPQNSAKLCYSPWKFQSQKSRPLKTHKIFPDHHLKIPLLFYSSPGNCASYFFASPRGTMFSIPPVFFSGIAQLTCSNYWINKLFIYIRIVLLVCVYKNIKHFEKDNKFAWGTPF